MGNGFMIFSMYSAKKMGSLFEVCLNLINSRFISLEGKNLLIDISFLIVVTFWNYYIEMLYKNYLTKEGGIVDFSGMYSYSYANSYFTLESSKYILGFG